MRVVKINIDGKDYSLGLNRNSIKFLESKGFTLNNFYEKPVTYYDILWASLFVKNHGDLRFEDTIELQDKYLEKHKRATFNQILKFGFEEYTAFINALADTNSEEQAETIEIVEE